MLSIRHALLTSVAALGCALTSACASEGPPPREEMARAHTLVEQADKSNAQHYAATDLQKAHEELAQAERSFGERKFNDAKSYAESAAVDADVASARGAAGEAQHAAGEVARGNNTLQQETEKQPIATTPPPTDSPK
jgi:Domain of unknown function (DUF4398)